MVSVLLRAGQGVSDMIQQNQYAIKYTTPKLHGHAYHFGQGVMVQHVIAKLRELEEGVRVLGYHKRKAQS